MAKHRVHSFEFKRQVVAEYAERDALRVSKAARYLSYLIRVWVVKAEAGEFDEEVETANLLAEYEGKISALQRLVGRQLLEIEFSKGALKQGRTPRSAPTFMIAGPPVLASAKAAGCGTLDRRRPACGSRRDVEILTSNSTYARNA